MASHARARAPLPQTPSYSLIHNLPYNKHANALLHVQTSRGCPPPLPPPSPLVVSLPALSATGSGVLTWSDAEAARIVTNREQPPPGAFSCECMHTQARYSRFWMCYYACVRVLVYVVVRARIHESATRLCNRVGGSEEKLRVAAELSPSLFPFALSLSVLFQRKMKGVYTRWFFLEFFWNLVFFFFLWIYCFEDFGMLLLREYIWECFFFFFEFGFDFWKRFARCLVRKGF